MTDFQTWYRLNSRENGRGEWKELFEEPFDTIEEAIEVCEADESNEEDNCKQGEWLEYSITQGENEVWTS